MPEISMLELASDLYGCQPRWVAFPMENVRLQERLLQLMHAILDYGGELWYDLGEGRGAVHIQNDDWSIFMDKWDWHKTPNDLSRKEYVRQRGQVAIPFYRSDGPGIVRNRIFYPLAGVSLEGEWVGDPETLCRIFWKNLEDGRLLPLNSDYPESVQNLDDWGDVDPDFGDWGVCQGWDDEPGPDPRENDGWIPYYPDIGEEPGGGKPELPEGGENGDVGTPEPEVKIDVRLTGGKADIKVSVR